MEEWKDIPGYEGLYQVSNLGRVKSFKNKTPRILRQSALKNGYNAVCLYIDKKQHLEYIHRLVALTFIPNPDDLPCINHKDENPLNNNVSNLEWCSVEYNNSYGTARDRMAANRSKRVLCVETGKVYDSVKSAIDNTGSQNISKVLQKKRHTSGGYHWEYIDQGDELRNVPRSVHCIELDQIFATIREAGRETGTCERSIGQSLRKERHTAGGYHWEYVI